MVVHRISVDSISLCLITIELSQRLNGFVLVNALANYGS
jgi:hypothetical protein